MAPPLPPGLMDDLIGEILLRLPPSDPVCLVRASLVCKSWRSLVLDRGFLREYRAFHRTAPMLGFFHDEQYGDWHDIFVPRFVPTTTMRAPPPLPEPAASAGPAGSVAKANMYSCRTLDCRHGRVLLHTVTVGWPESRLTVWDPVTGHHESFHPPSDIDPYREFAAIVLCASAAASDGGRCDHLECRGPFLVVIADVSHGEEDDQDGVAWVRVYSSETQAWGAATILDVEASVDLDLPSLLAAGAVYFMLDNGTRILKYDLQAAAGAGGAPLLSVMKAPPVPELEEANIIFATARDGELGAATLEGCNLHLWSWDAGAQEWACVRVIEQLDTIIPVSIAKFHLVGSAQGAGLVFICEDDDDRDIFTVELKSGHISNTGKTRNYGKIFPLTSFSTPTATVAS